MRPLAVVVVAGMSWSFVCAGCAASVDPGDHAGDHSGATSPGSGESGNSNKSGKTGSGGPALPSPPTGWPLPSKSHPSSPPGPPSAPLGPTIASIALANVGEGACSKNSAGSDDFFTSCTGNDGLPEYWCADFAMWVWSQVGIDTSELDAAAGSFYLYGENHGTLHDAPSVGDAVVFDWHGDGTADHVAIVTSVNADGTIESVSGDWDGTGSTEAAFSSTSLVVLNSPAYPSAMGGVPGVIGMTISGFVSPSPPGSAAAGCWSDTLGKEMPDDACVQSAYDMQWYECDDGSWTDRWTDAAPCDGVYPLP